MIANRIRRTPNLNLIRIRPALRSRAVPWRTSLDSTSATPPPIRNRKDANANVRITALHQGEIVSRPLNASVLAVAELKEGLVVPLSGSAPLGVAGKTHAGGLEGRHDGFGAHCRDVYWGGVFEHLKVAGDLVEGELLGPFALVDDDDLEVVCVASGEGGGFVVECGDCVGGECQESGEGQPGEMHDCR